MRTLRIGSVGDDVRLWESFLRGKGLFMEVADGVFDQDTAEAVSAFQRQESMDSDDGVVGPLTWAKGMQLGISVVEDESPEESGPNWPPRPAFQPMAYAEKVKVLTAFNYSAAPSAGNPEAIVILGGWQSQHIASVEIPQLAGVTGTYGQSRFQFHKLLQHQFSGLFRAWERQGLLPLVRSWGGSFAARFVRGSRTSLSNHSFGSAFDINVPWNGLGATPALAGREGSVRRLVPTAHSLGFWWGGHFQRPDGMHFEVARVMDEQEVEEALASL